MDFYSRIYQRIMRTLKMDYKLNVSTFNLSRLHLIIFLSLKMKQNHQITITYAITKNT